MKNSTRAFIQQIAQDKTMRWRLSMTILANGILILALVAQPYVVGMIIREVTIKTDADVRMEIALLAIFTGLAAIMAYAAAAISNLVLQDLRRNTKSVIYKIILSKPLEFFEKINEGWIEAAVSTASQATRSIVNECMTVLVRSLLFIILTTGLIFLNNPLYGFMFFTAAVIYLCLAYHLAHRISSTIESAIAATVGCSREAADMLSNIDSIRQSNMANDEHHRILDSLNTEKKIYQKTQELLNKNEFIQKIFLTAIFITLISSVAISLNSEPEHAITFYVIGLLAYAQLDLVGKSLNIFFEQTNKLQCVLEEIDFNQIDQPGTNNKFITHHEKIKIKLDNVSFGYLTEKPILSHLSLSIEPGSRHIISGPSGSGKSTFIRIITGQIQPQSGKVLVNGKNIHDLSIATRSDIMTIVPQNPVLFNRSIYENSTYGVKDVSYQHLEELLLALELNRLQRDGPKHWLYAPVDKNGMNLSGGEKQRILLARAILHAKPLLFLDEATSALDRQTEAAVLKVLHERLPHATIVAATHHPHRALSGYRTLSLV